MFMKPHSILPLLIVSKFVSLNAYAGIGSAITADVTVDTRAANMPPFLSPTAVVSNESTRLVTLAANAGDLDGSIVSYAWTWLGGSATTAAPSITLPYGSNRIALTVTDDDGASASGSTNVSLTPLASVDSDGDNIDDLVEFTLRNQGFDWNLSQPELAETVAAAGLVSRSKLASEGYYDLAGMRALLAPSPVIARNSQTGKVRLTLGVQQSSNLSSFTALPASATQVSVTPQGEISFEFDAPANAGFFRIEAK
jgi:hypothetical protein